MDSQKNLKHFINYFLIALVVGIVLFYGWYRARDFVAGPMIELSTPQNGIATTTHSIIVAGTAKNISDITLDGRKIFIDKEGHFSENILLHPGHNIISLNAVDRFGRNTNKTLEITEKE